MSKTALDTVQDYIADARVLLQDTIAPYRYDDASLLTSLNVTLLEARRLRADLFVYRHNGRVPFFETNDAHDVHIEEPFRLGILYGLIGHALTRDQEDVQDARATTFLNDFSAILQGTTPPVVQGGGTGGK